MTRPFDSTPISAPINDRISAFINSQNFNQRLNRVLGRHILPTESLLNRIRKLYDSDLGPALMEEFRQELFGAQERGLYVTGREEHLQPLIEWLKLELLKHKNSFRYIFETSRGSTYFVTPNLESLRFKMAHLDSEQGAFGPVRRDKWLTKPYMEVGQVEQRCYFIDRMEWEKIFSAREQSRGGMIDIEIQTGSIGYGMYPLEVNASYNHRHKSHSSIDPDSRAMIHIGENVFSYHPGTEITNIIHKK